MSPTRLVPVAVVLAALLVAGCGEQDAQQGRTASAVGERQTPTQASAVARPRTRLRLSRTAQNTNEQTVTIRGRVAPEATVTVRGRRATVRTSGRFRLRLRLREGTNRLTVVTRLDGHRPARRRLRIRYTPPAPAAPPVPLEAGQGRGGDLDPTQCPPGQVVAGSGGSCTNPDGSVPEARGSDCPPNWHAVAGGCAPANNKAYDDLPKGDAYGDQIPEVPGIQGE